VRPPIQYDNTAVAEVLAEHMNVWWACEMHPGLDDILASVLNAKTGGDTATRSLSRSKLFHILQQCRVISTAALAELLPGFYAPRTVEKYALSARVASMAAASYFRRKGLIAAEAEQAGGVTVTL
jgi:hypothetical protein